MVEPSLVGAGGGLGRLLLRGCFLLRLFFRFRLGNLKVPRSVAVGSPISQTILHRLIFSGLRLVIGFFVLAAEGPAVEPDAGAALDPPRGPTIGLPLVALGAPDGLLLLPPAGFLGEGEGEVTFPADMSGGVSGKSLSETVGAAEELAPAFLLGAAEVPGRDGLLGETEALALVGLLGEAEVLTWDGLPEVALARVGLPGEAEVLAPLGLLGEAEVLA